MDEGLNAIEWGKVLEKIDSNLSRQGHKADLTITGGGSVMYMGLEGRTTMDIDIVRKSSQFDEGALKTAVVDAGLMWNPTSDGEPESPFVQIIEEDNPIALLGRYRSTIDLPDAPQLSNISLKSIPPENIVASKLDRMNLKDEKDIRFLVDKYPEMSTSQIKTAIESFPVASSKNKALENFVIVQVMKNDYSSGGDDLDLDY